MSLSSWLIVYMRKQTTCPAQSKFLSPVYTIQPVVIPVSSFSGIGQAKPWGKQRHWLIEICFPWWNYWLCSWICLYAVSTEIWQITGQHTGSTFCKEDRWQKTCAIKTQQFAIDSGSFQTTLCSCSLPDSALEVSWQAITTSSSTWTIWLGKEVEHAPTCVSQWWQSCRARWSIASY